MFEFKDEMALDQECAFDLELATDVKLMFGVRIIKANKYVLMVHSDVFRAMFERWNEKDGDEVKIKDIEYEPMLAFMRAMYAGTIMLQDVKFALNVMTAADKYNLAAIKKACAQPQ